MLSFCGLVVILLTFASAQDNEDFLYGTFPDNFLWGCATSAYQIEGGWNADGSGENMWDRFTHVGGNVANNDTGDVACDSYNLYTEDVRLLADMGVDFYRFSLSWARILPDGRASSLNQAGIDYYNRLIDALLVSGVEPVITLYHWDLPQALQDIGGWYNEELVDLFDDYARVAYEHFGDRVKWWITFNEPWVVTWLGYGVGVHAPGLEDAASGAYRAAHTIIKSHARAYHSYNDDYKPTQGGLISITLNCDWKEPFSDSPLDAAAAERANQWQLGWYAHPIFVNGDYPEIMKETVARKSEVQGFPESRLPEFSEQEKALIQGTWDYFGLNHYTTQLIQHFEHDPLEWPSYEHDQDTRVSQDPAWPTSGSDWLKVVPWGLRNLLVWIKDNYNNPPLMITENGMSDRNATLRDSHRVYYYKHYINNVLQAIENHDCDVIGYTAWSLMDNFEWAAGYDEKFGIHHVDFNDPDRPRVPKDSALYYAQLIADNGFPEPSGKSDKK